MIRPYQTTPKEELETIQNISKFNLDFDDSLQYYVAKKVNATIVTYDTHFKKVPDIETFAPLRENWTEKGLLTETMLIEGFSLDSRIENLENFKRNKLKKVTSEFCDHALLVSFDDKINDETIAQLNLNDKDIFICLDSAITDQDKLRLSDRGLIKTI